MSRLIKAGNPADQARIVSLAIASPEGRSPAPAEEPAKEPPPGTQGAFEPSLSGGRERQADIPARLLPSCSEDDRHEFEQTIADLRQALDRAREEADQREEAAFERGLREGREEAADHSEQRQALLARTLEALQQELSARSQQMELLALQLAQAALGRIISDPAHRSMLIAESLEHHLERIRRDLVLSIRVSATDFPESEQWHALTQAYPALVLERDPSLPSGECSAKLKLGVLDLGLDGQWQRLCAFFESLAESEARQ